MNSLQINSLLQNVPSFLGVFSADTLPDICPSSFSLIVNTDSSDKAGTHWQAIVVLDGIAHFFDSFGGMPRVQKIKQFCKRFPVVHYNRKKHQNVSEETCGGYCVLVISEMNKGRSFNSILQTFLAIKRDDIYVRNYLINNFSFHL